jgi:hypothetical protein
MNINKEEEKEKDIQISNAIADGLQKLKKTFSEDNQPKEGVDLLKIVRKVSTKKFGKKE